MRKFNAKNLRREVQKQLKELRGGVGRMAVDHGLKVNGEGLMVNDESLTINGERLAVSGERLEGSDDEKIVNCPLTSLKSLRSAEPASSLCSHSNATLSIVKVCANERESSSLEFSQQVQPKQNDLVINSKRPTLPELERFVRRDYDLRYNVLTEQTEYRCKDEAQGEYRPVTQRVYRTWLTDLQREGSPAIFTSVLICYTSISSGKIATSSARNTGPSVQILALFTWE